MYIDVTVEISWVYSQYPVTWKSLVAPAVNPPFFPLGLQLDNQVAPQDQTPDRKGIPGTPIFQSWRSPTVPHMTRVTQPARIHELYNPPGFITTSTHQN